MARYGLEIRAATSADAGPISELIASCGEPTAAQAVSARIDALRRCPGAVLIALEWGPPSGIIALQWFATLQAAALTARITTLLVGPDARRRGIGRLLVKAGAQAARSAGCDTLDVLAPPDPTARDFRLASGFAEAGTTYARQLRKRH